MWLASALAVGWVGPAWADDAPRDEPSSPSAATRVDPLTYVGASIATVGAVGIVAGVPQLFETRRRCTDWGCVEAPSEQRRALGRTLVITGGATLASGLGILLVGVTGETPAVGQRNSEARLAMGAWVTGVGAGATAYALAIATSPVVPFRNSTDLVVPLAVAGVSMVGGGLALALSGAGRPERTRENRKLRSEGRLIAGIAMMTAGVPMVASALSLNTAWACSGGDFCGLHYVITGPILAGGMGLVGGGISLVVNGAREEETASATPTVALGPVTTWTWKFQ